MRLFLTALAAAFSLCLLAGVAASMLAMRLSTGPLDVSFARDRIEGMLSNEEAGYSVSLDKVTLTWPKVRGPLMLRVAKLKILRNDNSVALSVDEAGLGLSRRYLVLGVVRPVAIYLEAPALQLIRSSAGLTVLLESPAPQPEDEKKDKEQVAQEVITLLDSIVERRYDRKGLFSALRTLEINDAQLAVRDEIAGVSWYLTDFDFSLGRHPDGLIANFAMKVPGGESKAAGLSANLLYRAAQKDFTLTAFLQDCSPAPLARFIGSANIFGQSRFSLNGRVAARLDKNFNVQTAAARIQSPPGILDLPGHLEVPAIMGGIDLDVSYDAAAKTLDLKSLKASFSGIAFEASAKGTISDTGIRAPVVLKIADLPVRSAAALIPESERGSEAGVWLTQRLDDGRFYDASATADLILERTKAQDGESEWVVDAHNIKADFLFDNLTVRYNETLMPATKTKGKGHFENESLFIEGETGMVKDVEATNIKMAFTDIVRAGGGMADINMDIKGPLATVLDYIGDEPIALGDKLDFKPEDVKGTVALNVQLNFPTVKDLPKEDVKVIVKGDITDAYLPNAVRTLALSGGPLHLEVKDGGFSVSGKAQLAGRDAELEWLQYFDPAGHPFEAQVKAKVGADRELRTYFGVNLEDYISGVLPVDVVYTDHGDYTATLDLKGNLAPLKIDIKPFKYVKEPGVEGDLTLKAALKRDEVTEISDLQLKTQDFTVTDGKLMFGPRGERKSDLLGGRLPKATIGQTEAQVDFEITAENLLKVVAKGPVFDGRPFMNEEDEEDGSTDNQPIHISVETPRMIAKNQMELKNVRVYAEIDSEADVTRLEIDALAGTGTMYVRFKPNSAGKRIFRFEATDAGATMRAFDLFDDMQGGTLLIYGSPMTEGDQDNVAGVARFENFRIVKMPGLARLLSAMSLGGVEQLLSGEGVFFTKLEAGFEWHARPEGSIIYVKDGKTAGSSLGLSFEGTMDRAKQDLDMGGTLVPLSGINNVISSIPIIGDILTGGPGGGIIAASYTMKGPFKDPQVMVNPLSVLTPGILRKILFEGGYEKPIPPKEQAE